MILRALMPGLLQLPERHKRGFGPCFGCGKPARAHHCFKCQQVSPFAWEAEEDGVQWGRYKGEPVRVQRLGLEFVGYYRYEEVVGTRSSIERCRELLEKWCAENDGLPIRVVG